MNNGAPYLAAAITASVAVILWIASRAAEFLLELRSSRKDREKFIRALYAEIDFNTSDMEEFVSNPVSINAVAKKIRETQGFIPHITDARHTEIYKSNIALINFAGDIYIRDVIYFYGLLERIKGQIDGIYLPSYVMISSQGRVNVINRIFNDSLKCADTGREILQQMQDVYPGYRLTRKIRKASEDVSDADLRDRLKKLGSDLDRIRAAHIKAS